MSTFKEERSKLAPDSKRYGKDIISNFNVDEDLVTWDVDNYTNYEVNITHPEVAALCPVSGYPDYGSVHIQYIPDSKTVELKALKLWINSYRDKNISHEDLLQEIFSILKNKLEPKMLSVVLEMNPRGNVKTVVSARFDKE